MHPQSPPLTNGGTVLKESDNLFILGLTFDSNMTFEKHLRLVSRAASQRHGIQMLWYLDTKAQTAGYTSFPNNKHAIFHDRLLLRRCFLGFILPILDCFSSVLLGGQYTP